MHTIIREITSFEVPEGRDEAFLQAWNVIADQMRHAWGAQTIQMHESLDPQTKFRSVAVTEWESLLHYQAARNQLSRAFENLRRIMPFAAYPAAYRVVVSAVASPRAHEMFPR